MILAEDSFSFPIGSTGAVQHEDDGPWMHSIVEEMNGSDYKGKSYIIRVMKTGRLIMLRRNGYFTHTQHTHRHMHYTTTSWSMIIKSAQSPAKSEIRAQSGWISCKLETLEVDT